jgi:hypothetical protein
MFARVATFEGGDPAKIDEMVAQMEGEGGRPEGVPATGFLFLADRSSGKTLGIALFETEDDLKTGSAVLDAMSPPVDGAIGRRVAVETYEVPFHMI